MNDRADGLEALHETAAEIEEYIGQHLFDEAGLMYSGIDSHNPI